MDVEATEVEVGPSRRAAYRADQPALKPAWLELDAWFGPLLAAIIAGFALLGAANLDLGPDDAAVGLAAGESLGPLGRVFGYWRPELWPGRVALSALASRLVEDGREWPGTALLPSALAAAAIGWLLTRRLAARAGSRAGLLFALAWFGSVAVIDHSGATGLDFVSGLATVAALDRLLERRSDLTAGTWTALAFLCGGWPPVAIVLLAVIVIGRPGSGFSWRLLLPPGLALAGWASWMLSAGTPEALAAALALPFTRPSAWWLPLSLLALGLPLAPFALLGLRRSVRSGWDASSRPMAVAWSQVALACLVAGTVVPGLSAAAGVPALAGILLAAAVSLEAGCARTLPSGTARTYLALALGVALVWLAVVAYGAPFCLLMVSYYRPVGIVVLVLSVAAAVLAWQALGTRNGRRGVLALATLAVALKVAYLGVFVPERNYQHGEGPWGRAIGQWLLPNWTLYTTHEWPRDLAFAIGRPVRQLSTPRHLAYEGPKGEARHVLLLGSEFDHWPADAPALTKLAEFQDRWGGRRVLARTEGTLLTPFGAVIVPRTPGADAP